MDIITLLTTANAILNLAAKAGISWTEFKAVRDKAEAEGREPTTEELRALAERAQRAINDL